jgi:hypothetical protein
MSGQLIFAFMGARTPGVEMMPSRTCWAATPQGTPTSLAILEYPFGSPYSNNVDVTVSFR